MVDVARKDTFRPDGKRGKRSEGCGAMSRRPGKLEAIPGSAIVPLSSAATPPGLVVATGKLVVAVELDELGPIGEGLPALATEIGQAHASALRAASETMAHCRRAGELLLEAKGRLRHGVFQAWIGANVRFSYSTANAYMKVAEGWPAVEEGMASENLHRSGDFSLNWALGLLRARKAAEGGVVANPRRDEGPVVVEAGPAVPGGPDDDGKARNAPGWIRPVAGTGDADGPTAEEVEADEPSPVEASRASGPGHEPGPRAPGPDAALPGVPITEKSRCRGENILDRLKTTSIRARLEEKGNVRDFNADAAAWRLLRPLAHELAASPWSDDPAPGGYSAVVRMLALAKHPGDWPLCPGCDGSGRSHPGGAECGDCRGLGYLLAKT